MLERSPVDEIRCTPCDSVRVEQPMDEGGGVVVPHALAANAR